MFRELKVHSHTTILWFFERNIVITFGTLKTYRRFMGNHFGEQTKIMLYACPALILKSRVSKPSVRVRAKIL